MQVKRVSWDSGDLWVGGRRVVRVTRRRAGIVYGAWTVLRSHRGGLPVRRSEVEPLPLVPRLFKKTVLTSGFLLCTPAGSVLVQWRGWPVVDL